MKNKIFLFLFLSSYTITFSQKSHCRTLLIDTFIPDTIGMIDKSPYDQNTRANLIFYRRKINHKGCNENPYEVIVMDDFNNELDTTFWQTEYPYPPPFNKIHSSLNDQYLNTNNNVKIENGILNLSVAKDNPSYTYIDESGNEQTINHEYSLGMLHSKETYFGGWSIEAMGCYKYGKFSTRMKFPKSDDINTAFWFYGGGNEIDVFEIFHGTDNIIRSSIHQWNVITDDNDTHAEYGIDHRLGNLSEKFNTWEVEWTPFKISWSVNGKTFRTFYKYYQKKTIPQGSKKRVCFVGLECDEIPLGESVVYELSGWNSFSSRPIDLIIGLGITGTPKNTEKVEIDWIKIEQQPNLKLTIENQTPCMGEEFTITATHTNQVVEWEVSDDLEITSIENNTLTVIGLRDSTVGWVEATVLGNHIDLPLNNWTTIGYTYINEFNEDAIPFHNFSYSCQDTEMKVRKEIIIGKPLTPILENNVKPCLKNGGFEINLNNVTQYSKNTTFNWSTTSDASILEKENMAWVVPDTSLENHFFNFQLDITNDCGTSTFQKEIFIPDCKNDSNEPTLLIYPNPVNGLLHFGLCKTNYKIIPLSESPFFIVQTSTGRIIHQGQMGEDLHHIDTSKWASGDYKISYQFGGNIFSKAFLIIK